MLPRGMRLDDVGGHELRLVLHFLFTFILLLLHLHTAHTQKRRPKQRRRGGFFFLFFFSFLFDSLFAEMVLPLCAPVPPRIFAFLFSSFLPFRGFFFFFHPSSLVLLLKFFSPFYLRFKKLSWRVFFIACMSSRAWKKDKNRLRPHFFYQVIKNKK